MSREGRKARKRARREIKKEREKTQLKIVTEIMWIDPKLIYYPYREWRDKTHKYFRQDNGHILKFENCPLTLFALDYKELGNDIWDILDKHSLTKWEYDLHMNTTKKEKDRWGLGHMNGSHKIKAAKRMIKLIDSIKEYGYCEGKYDNEKYLIQVKKGHISKYGNDPNGYTLVKYKHRTAACIGLGFTKIKVILLKEQIVE